MYPPGISFVYINSTDVIPGLEKELKMSGDSVEVKRVNAEEKEVECLELVGVGVQILNWRDRRDLLEQQGLSYEFARKDFEDRINPDRVNPGSAVETDEIGVLKPHLNNAGCLEYTYSERMNPQLDRIIKTLSEYPQSRQAFLSIWDREIDGHNLEERRVPCSIGYHFLIRDGELNMLYFMRSLEVSKCMGYDIYTSTRLLEYVANRVKPRIKPGFFQMFIGSLHLFSKKGVDIKNR